MNPRREKHDPFDALTIAEPLPITLSDGTAATGTLWMHVSRRGHFEVEYKGERKSDGRRYYADKGSIHAIARILLREMAEDV